MRTLRCPNCGLPASLEALVCVACDTELALHAPSLTLVVADEDGTAIGSRVWVPCANRSWLCTWTVPADAEHRTCFACRLTRRRPEAADTVALEKLAVAAQAKRRLLVGLIDLGLPVVPHWVREGGLAFDLLSSMSHGQGPVTIGHANGVITVDLAESLDAHREQLRVALGEPYRTMLGHFRHEVGHYYQWQLLEAPGGPLLQECRALFGDERASYTEALTRHYATGAPADWARQYISEYATMHPWEDFAETFAHYQHIVDTLLTVGDAGLVVDAARIGPALGRDVRPLASYAEAGMEQILDDWHWVSLALNRANRAMGKADLYPFDLVEPVRAKLEFVHRVVQASRVADPLAVD